jgi:hypothetical protein
LQISEKPQVPANSLNEAQMLAGSGLDGGRQAEIAAYRIFDDILVVLCEAPEMGVHMHCFLKGLAIENEEIVAPTARLAVFDAPKRQVLLCCPELGLALVQPLGLRAWIAFRRVFLRLIARTQEEQYMLHASSVAFGNGNAAVIAGNSDAGKTSTVIALLQRGYRFVGDDYAVFTLQDGKMRALPIGVTITAATLGMFPELEVLRQDACKFYCQKQWQWTVNLGDIFPKVSASAEFMPTHFFFLEVDFGKESSLQECDRDQALWALQQHRAVFPPLLPPLSMHSAEYRSRCYSFAKELTQRARFFCVTNGDIQHTADLICRALGD